MLVAGDAAKAKTRNGRRRNLRRRLFPFVSPASIAYTYKKEAPTVNPHLTAVNLIMCKRVILDERTKLRSLVDLINRIVVEKFPSSRQHFYVHCEITGGAGEGRLELRIIRMRDDREIYRQAHIITFPDRTDILSPIFEVKSVHFPTQGFYAAELRMDGQATIGAFRRFEVLRG